LAFKGISPSTITNYLYNPIAFYKQKILHIKEIESVEETIAVKTMGIVIHDTLDELYTPCINTFLTCNHIDLMLKKHKEIVEKYFFKHFKNGEILTGKNRISFEISKRFVERFITMEKKDLSDGNQIKIIGTELNLETLISVPNINFPIKLRGIVDRIDMYNGTIRIIDYKTGSVKTGDLKVLNFEEIQTVKYSKAIQILLYAYMYSQHSSFDKEKSLEAGIISFKNLKSGLLKVNFSSKLRSSDHDITEKKLEEFIEQIKYLLQEIYNPEVSFKEPKTLSYS